MVLGLTKLGGLGERGQDEQGEHGLHGGMRNGISAGGSVGLYRAVLLLIKCGRAGYFF